MERTTICVQVLIISFLSLALMGQNVPNANNSNWPGFRGYFATGISENSSLPVSWNIENSQNINWKTNVPGLGFSSPVIWKNRLFLTTAISGLKDPDLKVGLYGDIGSVVDETVHTWKVFCYDKNTGDLLWERTSCTGIPKVKRHPKSTHANSTIATDGIYVVAFFGSEGLYCYDMNGKLLWKKDLGILRSNFFIAPDAEWGFASSPVINKGRVIVQCDVQENSFIASFDVKTGEEIWRTSRDEVPTWSTPTINERNNKIQIIVNGFKHIGGYDFQNGKEIWRMSGGGDIPVPTPVVAHDLIFINSAHGKMSPIYAIKINANGDISLEEKSTSNDFIVWSIRKGGSYMLTPLVYGDYLYNCRMNGSLRCYQAKTGEEVYKDRLQGSTFSASAVGAGGKIYFTGEEGKIHVVQAGPEFKLLAVNDMHDICMATPAISGNTIYFRTKHYLVAVSEN